jgi:hypothetical protein
MWSRQHFEVASALIVITLASLDPPAAQQRPLSDIRGLNCRFSIYASGTWTKGEAQAEVKPSSLSIGFKAIDTQDGTADAVGGFGPAHIVVRLAAGSLHFLQVGSSGSLYVTTVFNKAPRPGRLQAVHTRHEYTEVSLPGFTSRPEQYYGECEVTPDVARH